MTIRSSLRAILRAPLRVSTVSLALPFLAIGQIHSQSLGHPLPAPPPPGAKSAKCTKRPIPQLQDVTAKAGITFIHTSSKDKKFIYESMTGGVVIFDYDRDGWPDIYLTNAPTIDMEKAGQTSLGVLYHNNHDGTFTDVTQKSGLTKPCLAMGGAVGDYDNDGWPDLYITCLGGNILYHNNGDGTFTDVTAKAGVADGRWSAGAAFGDYDGDGYVDLMVANYVDFHLDDLPQFGSSAYCMYRGVAVQCGPRGLKGAGDSLFHNNGNGSFTDVSKQAGVSDPNGYYGLGVIWSDLNNTGRPDIYLTNDSTPKFLYRNLGHGKFEEIGFESGTALSNNGPGRDRWASPSATTTTPVAPRFMLRILKTKILTYTATMAIGISLKCLIHPVLPWQRCPGSNGEPHSSIWITMAGSISSPSTATSIRKWI